MAVNLISVLALQLIIKCDINTVKLTKIIAASGDNRHGWSPMLVSLPTVIKRQWIRYYLSTDGSYFFHETAQISHQKKLFKIDGAN